MGTSKLQILCQDLGMSAQAGIVRIFEKLTAGQPSDEGIVQRAQEHPQML